MAGIASMARDPGVSLTRVLSRLSSAPVYLGVLGGLQLALLWVLRSHFGILLPALSTAAYAGLLVSLFLVRGQLNAKLWAVTGLGVLTAIGPTVIELVHRAQGAPSMEHDGLIQVEAAIDKVMHGQPIYGIDWSNTPLGAVPWFTTPGPNPALHHQAYFPLTILVGVPVRALTNALGLPFDYRIVLIGFALVGLAAILTLPIAADGRFLIVTAVYMSPLICLYLWSGRNDIEFLAMVFVSLTLLARQHPVLASGALGVAAALKPFAWFAIPFLLLVLFLRWRNRHAMREVIASLAALALVPIATIAPFFLADPRAFWSDTVLYTNGGVADAYPIAGYGFGEFLYQMHVVARRTDYFPFGLVQLAAVIPTLWVTARAFLRRPSLLRWMGGYALVLVAFTFFARFFNDNYFGVDVTLLLGIRPLGQALLAPATTAAAELRAAA
jgi:glycosyl transferase family 87